MTRNQLRALRIARRHRAAALKVARLQDQLVEAKNTARRIAAEFDDAIHAPDAGDVRYSYEAEGGGIVVRSVDGTPVSEP